MRTPWAWSSHRVQINAKGSSRMTARKLAAAAGILAALSAGTTARSELLPGFVYLADIEASIVQDMRYAGSHNFVGRPIAGYQAAECIISEKAARALANAQAQL